MTQDDVIEMARDSGMELYGLGKNRARFVHHLEAFAHLVAAKALREHAMREVQRLGQEIEQEPVVGITAIRTWFKDGRVVTQTLCNSWVDTTPPQRTWVGLTDVIITQVIDSMPKKMKGFMVDWDLYEFVRAIEAAHGIKENT